MDWLQCLPCTAVEAVGVEVKKLLASMMDWGRRQRTPMKTRNSRRFSTLFDLMGTGAAGGGGLPLSPSPAGMFPDLLLLPPSPGSTSTKESYSWFSYCMERG